MNSYFASVGENLSKQITPPLNSNQNYLTGIRTVNQTMILNPITLSEMQNYINNLNANKSTKSTSPPIKFIKLSSKIISPILTQIFNCCIREGIFPDQLKSAEIIPIFKNGNKHQISNHRPISILDPFSKIFETHIFINSFQNTKFYMIINMASGKMSQRM